MPLPGQGDLEPAAPGVLQAAESPPPAQAGSSYHAPPTASTASRTTTSNTGNSFSLRLLAPSRLELWSLR
eukprot:CAMPEP_0113701006 /NCGR_PEP_ID=MMETSP0038_2-20120614/24313_1 /TAXON_ID=2898 /ORGANISM="Cryptomonas paramecium" /LENGTH=69 /DNA_ID=CAMNT_0000624807 /DNA_START=602 /DNA_END=807 /DNA_ORIENTATION=- /assembly_acc=CAM_ASM_000170